MVNLKQKPQMSAAAAERYRRWVASLGCRICAKDSQCCHYSGMASGRLGAGGRLKASDLATAPYCPAHHADLDQYAESNDFERGFWFLLAIVETLIRAEAEGKIKVTA